MPKLDQFLSLRIVLLLMMSAILFTSESLAYAEMQAQQREISGTVIDENGEELLGATVQVKGTTRGAQTGINGEYTVFASQGEILVFSYIGYKTLEVTVTDQTEINVVLEIDETVLEEVVVVGYGTQKKVNLTGSVQTVSFDEAVNQPVSNSAQLLYGRFSGVQLTQTSGNPGADGSSVVIRGVGTFGSRAPLVVIDNIQYDDLAAFNNLSPSDIASVTVLKDASSLAIYGARGANGVILVTTKKGRVGELTVEYNGYYGTQNPTVVPEYLGALDYATLMNEKFRNEDGPQFDPRYTAEQIDAIANNTLPDQFANTNWADEVLTSAPITKHNLSFRGGNQRTTYRVSAGFLQQDAIVRSKFKSERFNFGFNITSDVKDWLRVSSVTNAFWRRNEGPTGGQGAFDGDNGIIYSFQRTAPTIPLFYSNGEYGVVDGAYTNNNPSLLTQNPLRRGYLGDFEQDNINISTRTGITVELLEGLSFETSGSANIISNNVSDFSPTQLQNDWEGRLVITSDLNRLSNSTAFNYTLINENILRYEKAINKDNNISTLLGHSVSYARNDGFGATATGFASDQFREFNAGATEDFASGGASEDTYQSFFTRINYNFKEKYLAEFNYRIDGSSRFGEDNRYGYFPSGSIGWRISEEDFLSQIENINNLKVRVSWGITGNDRIARYGYQTLLSYNQDYYLGNSPILGASITRLGNPNIRWEETEQIDVGLDLNMFNNQLEVVADYFKRDSKDILYANFPIPNTLGVTSLVAENAASMTNEGIELGINYRAMFNKVSYSFGTNLTKFLTRSEVTGLGDGGEETITGTSIIRIGEPFRAYYGYQAVGIFQDLSEIANAPIHFNGNSGPGDLRYADLSGPDGVPDGFIDNFDRTVIGNPNPNWLINFNASIEFAGFDVNVLFQGVSGVDRLLMGNGNLPMPDNRSNALEYWLDRWTPENPSNSLPRVGGQNNELVSSFYIQDASYLRLKNLEIGYTLSKDLTRKLNVDHLRVFFGAQNIFTLTGLEYFDPEGATGSQSNRQAPLYKTVTLGINLKL
jgi:TonB-linked SusC/RagA family outer membrane protein